jgi:hypothetical protein
MPDLIEAPLIAGRQAELRQGDRDKGKPDAGTLWLISIVIEFRRQNGSGD